MSDKEFNNLLKVLLVCVGSIIVIVTLFLYLGNCEMKNRICLRILLFAMLVSILICCSIAIWKFPCEKKYCIEDKNLSILCDKGIIVVGEKETRDNVSYFENLEKSIPELKDGDTVYLWDSKIELKAEILEKLVQRKNLKFKFFDSPEINLNKTEKDTSNSD